MLVQTQGDAILLKTPQGKFVLIDGGGSEFYDVGANTVLPYLHRRGIRELYMLINTHPDWDHLGGLQTVAAQMPVDYIGLPASVFNCKEYIALKDTANRENTPVLPLAKGQYINLEKGLSVKVLNPGQKDLTPDCFS